MKVQVSIRYNPLTGSKKPFEVCWHPEGRALSVIASCKTETGARKSLAETVRRNREHFELEELN